LIQESEERVKKYIKDELTVLMEKYSKIERHVSAVQSECVRLDIEVSKIKEIIEKQQLQIEYNEQKLREKMSLFIISQKELFLTILKMTVIR
jgi:regulator of replication initiation timing